MKLLTAILPILSAGLAVPLSPAVSDIQAIHIVLQQNTITSETSVTVQNAARTGIVGHSCSTSLDSGGFETSPIEFIVDNHGVGTVTVGAETNVINDDPNRSGGIKCSRMYGLTESLVACTASVSHSLPLETLVANGIAECFTQGSVELGSMIRDFSSRVYSSSSPGPLILAANRTESELGRHDMERRQGSCGAWSSYTVKVGDGNPHQQPLHIQLSENMDCGSVDCGMGTTHQESFSIGFSASATASEWITGGFSVEKTIETGTYQECGGHAGDFICVWKKIGRTAYTVQNMELNQCTGASPDGGPFTMASLNSNNRGGNFYCVAGRAFCRNIGDRYEDPPTPGV